MADISNSPIKLNTEALQTLLDAALELDEAGSGLDTSDATATSSDILSGKTAYVNGEKVTGTIAFQEAKTITPSTLDQVAISSGYYASGAITVKGDPNLVASNIVNGKSIFGVVGTATTGGGGDIMVEDAIVTRNLTSYTNDRVTSIGDYAFAHCYNLASISFPSATTIGNYAFFRCLKLTKISFPSATTIGDYAFFSCSKLTSINFPMATTIGNSAFVKCLNLKSLYLRGSSICKLSASNAFTSTPIGGYSTSAGTYGSIYVPASLLTSYKSATNWAYFSSRFVGI